MSTQIPVGPKLTFRQGRKQPCVFPLTTGLHAPLDVTGKTLLFRIGPVAGGAALYELELDLGDDPADGRPSGTVDADLAAGTYSYTLYDRDADRDLVAGVCVFVATLDGPT